MEPFVGRRHTSKPPFASVHIYGSLSVTCLKSMYLHGFEGYKQTCGESQGFVSVICLGFLSGGKAILNVCFNIITSGDQMRSEVGASFTTA